MHTPYLPDVDEKLERIRAWLDRSGYSGLVLAGQNNFAWLSGGGNSRVIACQREGSGVFVITASRFWLVAQVMDGQRLLDEELGGLEPEYVPLRWYEESCMERAAVLAGPNPAGDLPAPGVHCVPGDIFELHYPLTAHETAALGALGAEVEWVLCEVAGRISPGMVDYQAEAMLLSAFAVRNIQCDVLLVGTDERISKYKHPNPCGRALGRYVLLHAAARRGGLHANVTRSVYFGDSLPTEIARPYDAACTIQAYCINACVPGTRWADILEGQKRLWAQLGYPDDWKDHYPGGRTGYSVCEAAFSLQPERRTRDGEAYDWFIAPRGAKVEELSLWSGGERQILSVAGAWPLRSWPVGNTALALPTVLLR